MTVPGIVSTSASRSNVIKEDVANAWTRDKKLRDEFEKLRRLETAVDGEKLEKVGENEHQSGSKLRTVSRKDISRRSRGFYKV